MVSDLLFMKSNNIYEWMMSSLCMRNDSISGNGIMLCDGSAEFTLSSPDFAKQLLGDASGEIWSLHEQIMSDFRKKVWSDFDKKLREYVTKNLNDLGYQFATEDEFIEFVKARLHRIGFEDKPHYYELYLDFVDYENKGTFIGSYSDNVDISWKDNTVTATIGRSIA